MLCIKDRDTTWLDCALFFCFVLSFNLSQMVALLQRVAVDVVQVLRSSEGRELRARHQENVHYLRGKLRQAGLPVIDTPSHIIPVHVCNPRQRSHVYL